MSNNRILNSVDVMVISTGAMISTSLFIVPAILYLDLGSTVIISYFLAALITIPGMIAKAELLASMPKSGGSYFFIQRRLSSSIGTFSGLITFFSLVFKGAFALFSIGYLLGIRELPIFIGLTIGLLSLTRVKKYRIGYIILIITLFILLVLYLVLNIPRIKFDNLLPILDNRESSIIKGIGVVFISFGGVTRIDSIADKIKNPKEKIPKGMFISFTLVVLFYLALITTFIGVGKILILDRGLLLLPTILGFLTIAFNSINTGAKYLVTLSKDNLIPSVFSKINLIIKKPVLSIITTTLFIIFLGIILDIGVLLTAASGMKLLLFSFSCLTMIMARENRIKQYKSLNLGPLYPWLIVFGFIIYITLIFLMGVVSIVIILSVVIFSLFWYLLYSKRRIEKDVAIIDIVKKVFRSKDSSSDLTKELEDILKERDDIKMDRFDRVIENATVIDITWEIDRNELFSIIGEVFSKSLNKPVNEIVKLLTKREKDSSTIIDEGLAIPHIVVPGKNKFDICIIRSHHGIKYCKGQRVKILFAIAGSQDERNFHLQTLMAIAQIVQNRTFKEQWNRAKTSRELKNLIILSDRVRKGII